MGTISVIPTRAALKKGFDQSTLMLTKSYDPVKLVSMPQDQQNVFVQNAIDIILQDIKPETYPSYNTMRDAAAQNMRTMLQLACDAFERDPSEASQDNIRKKWREEIPVRIASVRSTATEAFRKDRDASTESAVLKTLITKPVLLQRFQTAAADLRAIDLQRYYARPKNSQHSHVESIVHMMTQGTHIPENEKINFHETLHQKILEVSDMLNMTPYRDSMRLMSKEALKYKAEIGEWAAGFVLLESRAFKF